MKRGCLNPPERGGLPPTLVAVRRGGLSLFSGYDKIRQFGKLVMEALAKALRLRALANASNAWAKGNASRFINHRMA